MQRLCKGTFLTGSPGTYRDKQIQKISNNNLVIFSEEYYKDFWTNSWRVRRELNGISHSTPDIIRQDSPSTPDILRQDSPGVRRSSRSELNNFLKIVFDPFTCHLPPNLSNKNSQIKHFIKTYNLTVGISPSCSKSVVFKPPRFLLFLGK